MTEDDAIAAAHRAANGVLADWMRKIGLYDRRAELPIECSGVAPEVVWITLRPDRRAWSALADRERLALETFMYVLERARLCVRKALPPPLPGPRGFLAERIGDDEDRMPGLVERDRLR
ncbi:MAG: hypothetical protein AB7O57_04255 [Hyphomicrobiaceae bacterium]